MPIYEYRCSACGHVTDILHGVNESGPHFCPECGAEGTMRKAIAAPAVHFKGSGWAKKERRAGSATKDGGPKDGGPKDGGPKDDSPKDESPKDESPKDGPADSSGDASKPSSAGSGRSAAPASSDAGPD